jgi:hypothetical protein
VRWPAVRRDIATVAASRRGGHGCSNDAPALRASSAFPSPDSHRARKRQRVSLHFNDERQAVLCARMFAPRARLRYQPRSRSPIRSVLGGRRPSRRRFAHGTTQRSSLLNLICQRSFLLVSFVSVSSIASMRSQRRHTLREARALWRLQPEIAPYYVYGRKPGELFGLFPK